MKLLPKQFNQLSDILKEASAVVLGGLVIGTILSEKSDYSLVIIGFVGYITGVILSIHYKKFGE